MPRAYIFRGLGDSTNIKSNRLDINLTGITNNDTASAFNVPIYANDQILLFNNNQFGDRQYVEIFGEVRKEGKVKKYGEMTLQDLLYLSGGLKQSAEYGRIEISSIINIDSSKSDQTPVRTVMRTMKVLPTLELDSASASYTLKPFDQVYVRKNPNFELQQLVQVNGLVKYSGPYPRLSKNERLSSYIERAGGFTENADVSGAILYRKNTQDYSDNVRKNVTKLTDSIGSIVLDSLRKSLAELVSIDLYKALKYKNSEYDIILQDGDIIFVPEKNPFVSVIGTVQSSLKLIFNTQYTNIRYYIDKAGGFGIRPWKQRVYITYANGKSKRTKNIFFLHFYPKVQEGSIITVPFRPEGKEVTDGVLQVVLSSIPIVVATIIARSLN